MCEVAGSHAPDAASMPFFFARDPRFPHGGRSTASSQIAAREGLFGLALRAVVGAVTLGIGDRVTILLEPANGCRICMGSLSGSGRDSRLGVGEGPAIHC